MAGDREWKQYTNSRGCFVTRCEGEHVSLSELIMDPNLYNHYLCKNNIPPYPKPVTFYAPQVSHVTVKSGLKGIFRDGGFRLGQDANFLWWSLSVTEADIDEAEENFLDQFYPYLQAEDQESFLNYFTTSPAFQDASRYGNFRFTFPLKELLHHYSRQFCNSSAPVLRVFDTKIYKKEIMYTVLVHPWNIGYYNQYPKLPRHDGDVCGYFQRCMSWTCEAPSSAHGHRLEEDPYYGLYARKLRGEEYYVWDHVAIAFHMEPGWILPLNRRRLFSGLSVCEVTWPNLLRDPDDALSTDEAEEILKGIEHRLN